MTSPYHLTRAATALLAAALLAAAACNRSEGETTGETPPPAVVGPENIAVAEDTTLATGPALSGTLEPELAATVRAEVGGAVTEVRVDDGQPVKRGQVLARIDDTALRDTWISARAALRSAEATARLAGRNADRARRLNQAGAVADRELEDAETNATTAEGQVADARARLASAQKQLDKTVLRAPFDGVAANVTVSGGDIVQTGAELLSVVAPRTLRLEASVPAEDIAAVEPGTPVQFTVNGFEGRRFTGTITRVSPVVDPATRQVQVIATLDNRDRALVAGLFADGRVATASHRAVVVPRAAIDARGIRPYAIRVENGRVQRVEVGTGLEDRASELVEIRQGLAAGDTVLLGAAAGLTPGTPVTVRKD